MKISLKFRPSEVRDGILLYCAQDEDGVGDFTSLTIKNRRIEFRFHTGTGHFLILSDSDTIGRGGLGCQKIRFIVFRNSPIAKAQGGTALRGVFQIKLKWLKLIIKIHCLKCLNLKKKKPIYRVLRQKYAY